MNVRILISEFCLISCIYKSKAYSYLPKRAMPPQGFGLIKNQLVKMKSKLKKATTTTTIQAEVNEAIVNESDLHMLSDLTRVEVQSDSSEIRCYGCQRPSSDCTVPCIYPQKCFLRATDFNFTCKCIYSSSLP